MNIGQQLESFVNDFEPNRRLEILNRFISTLEEIVEDYLREMSVINALESAITDQENYDKTYGGDRCSALVDSFVLARLRYKTLN